MSEPIEIKIQDQVAPSIGQKLDQIASKARASFDNIERLKAALRKIDSAALNALSAPQSRAQKAMNEAVITSARLTTEQQRQSAATLNAATAQQRLQTAATATAVAQQNLATATARTATEQARQASASASAAAAQTRAASAALRLEQQQAKLAQSTDQLAREAEQLKRSLNPLYAAHQQYNDAVQRATHLHRQGAIDAQTYNAALTVSKAKLEAAAVAARNFNAAQAAAGRGAQLHRMHLVNLGFQLQDIGVMLASGQNPLIIMAQQGAQIGGIASQAGVGMGRLAIEAAKMMARFIPIVAVITSAVAALKLFGSEATKGAKLDEFARGLGATDKQIKELSLDTVTLGDTLRGLFKTIDEATGISDAFGRLWEQAKTVFTAILKLVGTIFSSVVALGRASIDTLVAAWEILPNRFQRIFYTLQNDTKETMEGIANSAIDAVNSVLEALNKLPGSMEVSLLQHVDLGRVDTSQFDQGAAVDLAQTFVDAYVDNLAQNQGAIESFIKKWQANSVAAAKTRIADELEKPIETRAQSLQKINVELDNELQRLFLLRPAREAQARFDQIEEQMLGKKITLHDGEAASLRRKIATVEAAKVVQQQFDRIYEAAIEPLRTYNAAQAAGQKLLVMGAQYSEAAARAVTLAREAYLNSIDPLRQVNKEISDQNALLAMLPRQREVEQQLQQIANQQLAEGKVLTDEMAAALRARLISQQQLNIASQAEAQVWEATRGAREQYIAHLEAIEKLRRAQLITGGEAAQQVMAANPTLDFTNTQTEADARVQIYDDMYKRINDLQDAQLISERTAAALRLRVFNEAQQAQLSTASNFFGQLSVLQKSENSKVAKIGKAAAIAKAIMDTYTAATGAYASLASIPYVGPALGIAAAAAAISAGMQNVQAIRAQPIGFQQGGYTGDAPRNAVAGAVHGQEFVMNAAATKRIGVQNLQTLQKGGKVGGVKVSIENYGTSKDFEVQQLSETEVRIIARDEADRRIVEQAPRVVASQLADPNSRVSKSINRNTNASRKR